MQGCITYLGTEQAKSPYRDAVGQALGLRSIMWNKVTGQNTS